METTIFRSIDLSKSASAWQKLFHSFWPAYRAWFTGKKGALVNSHELALAQEKFAQYMPELVPAYQKLVQLTGNDPVAAQFLTMYRPPAYLVNCSQAILNHGAPFLIRNYDLSPELSENTITLADWLGQKVMSTNECLWGCDDGMNEAGLAISLTFGGNKNVGDGFGIPIIMRYILHTCTTVSKAIKVLQRIPSHMAYNVTLIDASGDFATVFVGLNCEIEVTQERAITNHQSKVVWPEQAQFSKTIERKIFLDEFLTEKKCDENRLKQAFLTSPLRSTQYDKNFGTVFTATYSPQRREMSYLWPNKIWTHCFDDFEEAELSVDLCNEQEKSNNHLNPTQYFEPNIRTILNDMLTYLNTNLVPNQSALTHLRTASQANDYDWASFATDFTSIWYRADDQSSLLTQELVNPISTNDNNGDNNKLTNVNNFSKIMSNKPKLSLIFH